MEKISKKVYIETLGCQMNKSDTERILGILSHFGYLPSDENKADFFIVNTCSIRKLSEDKAYSKLGVWGKMKESNPNLRIGICGCVAQQEKENLLKKIKCFPCLINVENPLLGYK